MIMPSQEELDKILEAVGVWRARDILLSMGLEIPDEYDVDGKIPELTKTQAKSAINSLTLKQVLALIGEDEMGDIPEARARNAIRAELRQSAERIWKS